MNEQQMLGESLPNQGEAENEEWSRFYEHCNLGHCAEMAQAEFARLTISLGRTIDCLMIEDVLRPVTHPEDRLAVYSHYNMRIGGLACQQRT
jgi:hypothetical protein